MRMLPLPTYGALTPSDVYPGYGGYAGAPSAKAQDALSTMMDNVIGALSRGTLSVKARAAVTGAVMQGLSSAALDSTVGTGLSRLDGPDRNGVLSGGISGAQWVASAAQVGQMLITAAQAVSDTPTVNLISSQLAQATTDAEDIAAGRFGTPLWVWLAAAGAGAFVLWKMFGSGKKVRRLSDYDDLEPEDALD